MAVYFLDTSAVVKRYVAETGSAWVTSLCDPATGHIIVISQATLVEAVAAICRKARLGTISQQDRDGLINAFRRDARRSYSLERVTSTVYSRAGDLCRTHPLRAYDAVQLACALALASKTTSFGVPAIFVCADTNLIGIAATEGLATDNPEGHP
ncbi:MAG TPA: type II toxin-antitoxin system VapC family toxin [Ktedonobacterales bacterium]|nr:type II toxin-antitoxin system VapC family toxin [Ktedonobacterales bacterium]